MYKINIIILLCFTSTSIFAQQKVEISGVVKVKHNDNVLSYAQVVLDGTTIGAVTDEFGQYQLTDIPVGEYKLKVMYTGYKTEVLELTLESNNDNNFNIILEQSPISIEEILVTGDAHLAH